ncbi:MAG: hypothetical protein LC623_08410 [Halobacteriales archaeon]|nr:hypothetical protein [Halobacteriales archaeon]
MTETAAEALAEAILVAEGGIISGGTPPSGGGEAEFVASAANDDTMAIAWDASKRPGLQRLLEELKNEENDPKWTEQDFRDWMLNDQEKAERTVTGTVRQLRFMAGYKGQPVMLHGSRWQFVMSGRLYYQVRKDRQSGSSALGNDLKALRLLSRFLGIPKEVWPVSPPMPQRHRERIPTPEEIHGLLHTTYARDHKHAGAIENAWVRHVLAMHFGLGLRSPKEFWFLRATDFDPTTGILLVTEPKKRHRERTIFVEPTWLAKSRRHLSLEGWLKWREKLNPEGKAMFPNPLTGKDFPTPEAFKEFLVGRVKPRFPWFHPYLGRKWCVYARIIDAGFTDSAYNQVAEWFGHESVDMTRDTYGPAARAFSKSPQYGEDWLSRAFQQPRPTSQRPKNA